MRIGVKENRPEFTVPTPVVPVVFRIDLPNDKSMNLSELQKLLNRGKELAAMPEEGDMECMAALAAGKRRRPSGAYLSRICRIQQTHESKERQERQNTQERQERHGS